MKNYNEQLQEILDKLVPTFQQLKENKDTCTSDLISKLIGINCSRKTSVNEILDSMSFTGAIYDFFRLILSRLSLSPIIKKEDETDFGYIPYRLKNDEGKFNYVPISTSNAEFSEFKKHLIEDLKILLLKDAILNLSDRYSENAYGEREVEIFFGYSDFKQKVSELAKRLEFDEDKLNGLKVTIEQYSEFINLKAPKISFPWIAFSLCKTFSDLPVNNKRSDFHLVRGKNLALKSLGRNQYQKSYESDLILTETQKTFSSFTKYLKDYCSGCYPTTNESLSFYLFNEITNLFDLHMLFTDFSSRAIDSDYDDSNRAKLQINKHFESFSKLCLINPLGVKCYLINTLEDEEIYSDEKLWLTFNNLCTIITVYICCIIEENNLVEENNSLSIDHLLYDQLHEEEPYNIEWAISTLDIYDNDSSKFKVAYYYAYKNLYDTKFHNKKNKYPYINY